MDKTYNKMQKKNKTRKYQFLIWTLLGVLLLAGFGYATTISDTGSIFTGSANFSKVNIIGSSQDLLILNQTGNQRGAVMYSSADDNTTDILRIVALGPGGRNLFLESYGGGPSLVINHRSNGDITPFSITSNNTGLSTFKITSNGRSSSNNAVFLIDQIDDQSTQRGTQIAINGTGTGLYMDMANSLNTYALELYTVGTRTAIFKNAKGLQETSLILHRFNNSNFDTRFFRNLDSGSTAAPVVLIHNNNVSDDQPSLTLQNDGSGTNLRLVANITAVTCNSANAGGIYYDGSVKKHFGCNSTAWNALY